MKQTCLPTLRQQNGWTYGALANQRQRLGLRWQVRRDTAFRRDASSFTGIFRHPKAPSSLRSAGAVQKLTPALNPLRCLRLH